MVQRKNNLSPKLKWLIVVVCTVVVAVLVVNHIHNKRVVDNNELLNYNFDSSVKISLLNGCGYRGIATEVKDYFVEKNFSQIDVISWKNVPGSNYIYDKTVIVMKREEEEKLKYLMEITGIPRKIISLNEDTIEEFQIILGKDYLQYFK